MEILLRYRGRDITALDVQSLRGLIASHPKATRRRLSEIVCEAWNWRQPNGALCGMQCRGLMLSLFRAGHIALPPPKTKPTNPLAVRRKPHAVDVDQTPISVSLRDLGPLIFHQVRRTSQEALFNSMLERFHYLGYTQPVGEALKFVVFAGPRPVALFAWSSAPRHLAPRDKYIGWAPEVRRQNLHLLTYNTRYLVPPWVRVPHLASHVLSRMTRLLPSEWQKAYGHTVHFAETFVDTSIHRGTCYRAANWLFMGRTTGRGKADNTGKPNRTLKDVLGLPLHADFRDKLLKLA
jgi:hypothetical protein